MGDEQTVNGGGRCPSPMPKIVRVAPDEDRQTKRARLMAIRDLPLEPYVGLTRLEAQALADQQGRELQTDLGTWDSCPTRVRVQYDGDGRIRRVHAG